jgi:single-stranded DNA-binding protein
MPEAAVSFAGTLTDDPELRHTEGGTARATFRVAIPGRTRDSEPSFFTVVVWRDQAEHAAQSLAKGSRVVVVAGSSSGPGRPRMAAPDPWSRWWPRSWGRACGGRPPRRAGDQDATTEGTSVELTLGGLWVQRSTSPDEWNCGFGPARGLNRLLDREPFGS